MSNCLILPCFSEFAVFIPTPRRGEGGHFAKIFPLESTRTTWIKHGHNYGTSNTNVTQNYSTSLTKHTQDLFLPFESLNHRRLKTARNLPPEVSSCRRVQTTTFICMKKYYRHVLEMERGAEPTCGNIIQK